MQKFSLTKGFTLIELLVVIAILGILDAVVLIAINPAQRIAEANDTQVRSDVSTIASAVEACFTSNATGTYTGCNTVTGAGSLQEKGFLKSAPKTTPTFDLSGDSREIIFSAPLSAQSAKTKASCTATQNAYYTYNSSNGSSTVVCGTTSPVLP